MPSVVEDKLLTRYLLGTLTKREQEQVEEHLFADADCYDRLCALKEELTELKDLFDSQLLNQVEFDAQRANIMKKHGMG